MVFELVYEKRVCRVCGQKHIEETHHGNQRIVLLTTTGKILPALMLVVIFVFIAMSLTPYTAGIVEFFYNAFAAMKAFFISIASSAKAFFGM